VVKGYTDASGDEKINLWISQERAKSVKRYLGKHGIPLKNITAKGFGESELLYGDKPYSELNRRVEIEIRRR
jgi:OOP family OmpA-OmpF porin